jgi:hypothetical protein
MKSGADPALLACLDSVPGRRLAVFLAPCVFSCQAATSGLAEHVSLMLAIVSSLASFVIATRNADDPASP